MPIRSPRTLPRRRSGVAGAAPRPAAGALAAMACAWLAVCAGCAGCAGPADIARAPASPPAASAPSTRLPEACDTPCAAPPAPDLSPQPDTSPLAVDAIAAVLRDVAALGPAQAAQRQQQLQALGTRRTAGQRVELAWLLLTRGGASADDGAQAQDLLRGLDASTPDRASQQLLRMLQRLARQNVELSQSRAELVKSQRKVADLEDKIGQIKNLEVQLQTRPPQPAPREAGKGATPSRP